MNFYPYRTDANNFAGIEAIPGQNIEMIDVHFDDTPLARTWRRIVFQSFETNPEQQGDFPSLVNYSDLPVLSLRAWDCLRPLIGSVCEALPIDYPTGEPYFIIHVVETTDCLDEERSELRRNEIDGRVSRVFKYCFHHEMIDGRHIVKLPLKSGGALLVDEVFRQAVEDNDLKGLVFRQLMMTDCAGPGSLGNR